MNREVSLSEAYPHGWWGLVMEGRVCTWGKMSGGLAVWCAAGQTECKINMETSLREAYSDSW
jgi:hypothetical protein